MSILRNQREKSGRAAEELAAAAGISVQAYYDLETHDDELNMAVSIAGIGSVARELDVKPSVLYGGSSSRSTSLNELVSIVRKHIEAEGRPVADFEIEIGWSIEAALSNPEALRGFNADGLKAVCEAVNVNWFEVLDGLVE